MFQRRRSWRSQQHEALVSSIGGTPGRLSCSVTLTAIRSGCFPPRVLRFFRDLHLEASGTIFLFSHTANRPQINRDTLVPAQVVLSVICISLYSIFELVLSRSATGQSEGYNSRFYTTGNTDSSWHGLPPQDNCHSRRDAESRVLQFDNVSHSGPCQEVCVFRHFAVKGFDLAGPTRVCDPVPGPRRGQLAAKLLIGKSPI